MRGGGGSPSAGAAEGNGDGCAVLWWVLGCFKLEEGEVSPAMISSVCRLPPGACGLPAEWYRVACATASSTKRFESPQKTKKVRTLSFCFLSDLVLIFFILFIPKFLIH